MSQDLAGGAALVIGGSGAIGAAIARKLASTGNDVALSYHGNEAAANAVVADVHAVGRQALALRVNLEESATAQAAVASTIARFGHIHSVVYAAGPKIEFLYINEITPAEWARVMAADVNGCFNVVAAVLPHLRERRSGSIVAVLTGAVDRAPPRDILSAAPKAAIQMLIRGVAREEGRSGIRANCVGPGMLDGGIGLSTLHEHTADYRAKMIRAIPLRRAGTPGEVADVVSFLISAQSAYVSGATIPVAGGLQLS